jgi:ATP-dependent Clp endopeptidase proteolytic subunit ClpP
MNNIRRLTNRAPVFTANLDAENASRYEFHAEANGEDVTLLIYGFVSGSAEIDSMVGADKIARDLASVPDARNITVKINSKGGDVFAGTAIYNTLKNHPANVTVYIDGLAASIASVIAMAGDTVIMPRNAMMMIHAPSVAVVGNADELTDTADTLRTIAKSMSSIYESKTGLSSDEIAKIMDAETWFSPEEALAKGFIDRIDTQATIKATAQGKEIRINGLAVSKDEFTKFPQAMLAVEQPTTPTPNETGQEPEDTMKIKDLIASLRRFFGAEQYPQINSALDVAHSDIPEDASVESAAARIHEAFQGTIDAQAALLAPLDAAGIKTAEQITALLTDATAGQAYRAEMIEAALASATRAKGEKFDAEAKARYERLFAAMTLDDIKAQKAEWDEDAKARLGSGGRQTTPKDANASAGNGDDDDETVISAFLMRTSPVGVSK